jgi:hypothetical protein
MEKLAAWRKAQEAKFSPAAKSRDRSLSEAEKGEQAIKNRNPQKGGRDPVSPPQ